jgi:tetratricopeptide (TPR) repeat protein
MLRPLSQIAVTLTAAALLAGSAFAHDPVVAAGPKVSAEGVPLHDDLGNLAYPVDTRSALAQRYFDQGLRLAYAFHHAEALRSFRAAQTHDSACAMCYWGEAFVLGPNINAAMQTGAANPAVAAVRKARALAHDPRARALIEALAKRYTNDAQADQGALNRAYAEAMGEVRHRYPDDQEIAVLYTDALMNTSPWDYWEADGLTPKGKIGDAIRAVEQVLQANPNHPGAIHFYIHLTEASKKPERAEPYADKLAALMPGAGHLVHMPSHIYFRVGRYRDSAETNKTAVRVDEGTLKHMDVYPIYRNGYYPHAIHFVIASAQMAGDRATALEYAHRLEGKIAEEAAATIGWVQRILTVPYFVHAQFSTPQTILAPPDPGNRFPFVKAAWHYARGVAFAQNGNAKAARIEAANIATINQTADLNMLLAWGVPAPDVLRIARHIVEARIAQSEGDLKGAVQEFQIAVSIQDSLPYMEPPHWYYPVRQSLGAALLAAGQPTQAIAVLKQSLERYPNNVHALSVLRKAQAAAGDDDGARATARRIEQAAIPTVDQIALGKI